MAQALTTRLHGKYLAWVCAVWMVSTGCGGDSDKQSDESSLQGNDGGPATAAENPCADVEPGTGCGKERHCIEQRCTANVCGDGFALGTEECDDGNQTAGDGCSPSCSRPALSCGDAVIQDPEECDDGNWYNSDECSNDCTKNECGNGREDDVEECDDENRVDTDKCSNACTENRCRNGRLDPGEECDDGNTTHADPLLFSSGGQRIQGDVCSNACVTFVCGNGRAEDERLGGDEECDDGNMVNDDACSITCTANKCGNKRIDPGEVCDGNTASQACSADCKTLSANTACDECRARECTNYEGLIDALSGCYNEQPSDPKFNDECIGLVGCAKRTGCAYTEANISTCFCGTFDPSACQLAGNQNGECMAEVYTAARTSVLQEVAGRLSAIDFPLGYASYLLRCERELCPEQCVPK